MDETSYEPPSSLDARGGAGTRPRLAVTMPLWPLLLLCLFAVACVDADPDRGAVEVAEPPASIDGPVAIDVLRGVPPDSVPGLSRLRVSGERGGVAGARTSRVTVEYGAPDGAGSALRLVVTDLGPLRGEQEPGRSWMLLELDSESESGYERTLRLEGHPAYERYSAADGRVLGEVQVVVGRRFVLEVHGTDVEMEALRSAVRRSDLARLRSIAGGAGW